MARRLAALILALAGFTGPALAESWQVPQPYVIPLPPTIEPNFELGLRYWASEGDTNRVAANGGLHYDSVDGNSGEFVFRAQNSAQFFGKGFVGGGGLSGGTLEGSDSQVGLAATNSRAGDGSLVYGTIDIGKRFDIMESGPRFSVSPFIGLNIFQEKIAAFGADGVSSSTKVFSDDSTWTNLRLGGEARLTFCDRITLIADVALLPVAYLSNEERIMAPLGALPNVDNSGTGWGYQIDAEARYDFGPQWSAGAGFRYWYAEVTDGDTRVSSGTGPTSTWTNFPPSASVSMAMSAIGSDRHRSCAP